MAYNIEKFILKYRHHCEMPDVSGLPVCRARATRIMEMQNGDYCYTVAVCDDCASYVRQHRVTCKTQPSVP